MAELPALLVRIVEVTAYFIAALFPLVLAHELGHFVVAKLNHVRVDEFGLGFPPRIMRLAQRAETEYTLNALPLGGFVRLAGEDDPGVPGAFAGRSKKVRTAVLLAGPGANFLLAAVVIGGAAMLGQVPELIPGVAGVSVLDVRPGSQAEAGGLQDWDIIVATDGVPLAERQLSRQPGANETVATVALQDATNEAPGQPMTVTVLRGVGLVRLEQAPAGVTTKPAELPGVVGDTVVTAPPDGGVDVGTILVHPVAPSADGAAGTKSAVVGIVVGEIIELTVTPLYDEAQKAGRMGITIIQPAVPAHLGLIAAAWHGLNTTRLMMQAMVGALAEMFSGQRTADLRGPLGIADLTADAGEQGLGAFVNIMIILSINLGIINLVPIPGLDGGRLLFIGAEAVRGRRIEQSREAVVHLIGFAFVIALLAILTVHDAARWFGGNGP